MIPFAYLRVAGGHEAIAAAAAAPGASFVAGGTTLLDLMKLHVLAPTTLVDVNRVPLAAIAADGKGVRIGALARMAEVAAHPAIAKGFPMVAQALLASASPQIRNMASIGGNLLQKVRCPYYRDVAWNCNKRSPGSGCAALDGENRMHAILGGSGHCIATHPSDLAVALAALEATVVARGPQGERRIPFVDFHPLPGATPHVEHPLAPAELIEAVEIPSSAAARRSVYVKVRDRASFEFALVSAAAGLATSNGTILEARLALGGVGTKPWRVPDAEAALLGKPANAESFAAAAEVALRGAVPRSHNGFKVELCKRAVVCALTEAGGVR